MVSKRDKKADPEIIALLLRNGIGVGRKTWGDIIYQLTKARREIRTAWRRPSIDIPPSDAPEAKREKRFAIYGDPGYFTYELLADGKVVDRIVSIVKKEQANDEEKNE